MLDRLRQRVFQLGWPEAAIHPALFVTIMGSWRRCRLTHGLGFLWLHGSRKAHVLEHAMAFSPSTWQLKAAGLA